MKNSLYADTSRLLKTYFKGSKVITLLLVILPFLLAYGIAASNNSVLTTPTELQNYIAQNQGNPLLGNIAANTIEAASVWRVRISAAVILAILNVILVISHTRKEEDSGRLELIRAGAIGRFAPLAAVFIKIIGANLLGGIAMMLAFIAVSFPVAGAFAAGMSIALSVCFIAALTAVLAQIAPNARLARGLSFGAIAIFVIINVVANSVDSYSLLMWTPFGWCAYARPYADENWLFFLFAIPINALMIILAFTLMEHRDINSGYLREMKSRSVGRRNFKSPFALSWRLQKGTLFVWLIAYTLMGLVIGSLVPTINEMFAGTTFAPELSAILGGPGRAFLAILSYILTQVVTAFAIMTILRYREEESLIRSEMVLSAPISRINYITGPILISYLGSAAAIVLFGLFTGDFISSISRIPAVWITVSITMLFYGIAPRVAAPIGWGFFGIVLAIEFMWEMRFVGNGVFRLSPFSWVYPGTNVSLLTIILMILVSAVLTGIGLVGFTRRNIVAE